MKEYIVNGKHYLFKEGEQPEGAVEFKTEVEIKTEAESQTDAGEPETEAEPRTKAVKPANKSRETKKK